VVRAGGVSFAIPVPVFAEGTHKNNLGKSVEASLGPEWQGNGGWHPKTPGAPAALAPRQWARANINQFWGGCAYSCWGGKSAAGNSPLQRRAISGAGTSRLRSAPLYESGASRLTTVPASKAGGAESGEGDDGAALGPPRLPGAGLRANSPWAGPARGRFFAQAWRIRGIVSGRIFANPPVAISSGEKHSLPPT